MTNTKQYQANKCNCVIKHIQRIRSNLSMFLVIVLLSLPVFGCSKYFMSEGNYVAPDLPKSELAALQVDTDGQWIQRINQIVLRINGKVALRKNFGENAKYINNEIYVGTGKNNLSVLVLTDTYPDGKRQDLQINLNLSADLKAGGKYLVIGKFENNVDDDLTIELIDTNTDKVISKSNLSTKSTVDMQNPGNVSIEYEF